MGELRTHQASLKKLWTGNALDQYVCAVLSLSIVSGSKLFKAALHAGMCSQVNPPSCCIQHS
jgi:hypothetical protein